MYFFLRKEGNFLPPHLHQLGSPALVFGPSCANIGNSCLVIQHFPGVCPSPRPKMLSSL